MATPFTRTLRSIRSDGFRLTDLGALVALALLAAWTLWFLRARVDVVETCSEARIALQGALFPIETPVGGSVSATHLELGRRVQAGDVLVELDCAALLLERLEERGRSEAARAELAALRAELEGEELASAQAAPLAVAVAQEERLRRAQQALALELARGEVARLEQLATDGIVSELELVRARGAVQSCELGLELQDASRERREREEARATAERGARIAGLQRELERQRGLVAAGDVRLERLAQEIGERSIRAPRDGTLAEVRDLARGASLQLGERVAALVSSGELSVVADFRPAAALGRIAVGQRGELRLDGFPWSRFGTLGVSVVRVGGEPRDGLVRVEFALDGASSTIPLQHGLPGVVEVVVERVSPAELVLRSAGLAVAATDAGRAPGRDAERTR